MIGEIYQVDDQTLEALDRLEEHPTFYVREKECIQRLDNKQTVECWVYFLKKFRPELLNSTFLTEYSSTGPHGLVYAERYLRDPLHPARKEVFIE